MTRTKSSRLRQIEQRRELFERSSPLRHRQRQHAGRPAEAHRRLCNDPPALWADLDRPPGAIGEIEVDVALVLGDADMDRPLGAVELRPRLEQIERRVERRSARGVARSPRNSAAAARRRKRSAADRPGLAVTVDHEIGKGGAGGGVKQLDARWHGR